ncbi:MAG: T9SS type A sorting domain-containing protein [Bacteroidetes bacterium]|nr:T9SS C-terminal target domain-containing protein [Bacteroidota bacterium]MCL4817294.1 zinc-dependent metalloprotease [Flavobacteriales bacterium]NOG96268.1 T9SS type A sorting domain-containing protein [Bacteroidota bacterium]WKZ75768.1 MAG: zinc-dependent metalloprotease [Vicingaceae bacterium]CAG0994398.1 hypothetical protein FLAV_02490 [Flavobacteriales bacterium]
MKYIILLFFFIYSITSSYTQVICGTEHFITSEKGKDFYSQLNEYILKEFPSVKNNKTTTIIPLVFHIVYSTPQQNVHDSVIYRQLDILNNDFQRKNADTSNTPSAFKSVSGALDVEFCLAKQTPNGQSTTGILRVQTATTSFASPVNYGVPDPIKRTNMGGSDSWDTEKYINIWICNLTGSTAYTAPKGNFLPGDDGIVCHYNHIGLTNGYPYNKGRSIVHEMGHYFGLKHIWGDDNGTCAGTDFINDTPNQANYSTNCPSFPLVDVCSPNSPGVMYMNYMDYSEDACRNMFTQGQVNYMIASMNFTIPNIHNPTACSFPSKISEKHFSHSISFYPNPFSDNLLVTFSAPMQNGTLQIKDLNGKTVFLLQHITANSEKINTSFLSEGIYFLEIFDENFYSIKKLIKIK